MPRLSDRIEELLRSSADPLAIPTIAERLGVSAHDVDRVIWAEPDRFAWQPGHKWALGVEKTPPRAMPAHIPEEDARERPLTPARSVELRAITLASGVRLRISRRPLDTHAFFSVKSAGNEIELTLNSGHEVFAELPMPFADDGPTDGYKAFVELLLEAWALYEDSFPGSAARRATEDTRLLWGRRVIELLRDGDAQA